MRPVAAPEKWSSGGRRRPGGGGVSVPERKEATGRRRRCPGKQRKEGGGAWASAEIRGRRQPPASDLDREQRGGGLGQLLKRPCNAVLPDFTSKNVETNVKTA